MNTYNVLWFDDEHPTLHLIRDYARRNGITLHGVDNAEDGLDRLRNRHHEYDAVLLDGVFFSERGTKGTAMGDDALRKVSLELTAMRDKKYLPKFILTGQLKTQADRDNLMKSYQYEGFFTNKSDVTDLGPLWQAIKDACDKLPDTKLRHQHQKVFEACEKYVPEAAGPLMKVLRAINFGQHEFDDAEQFNQLRIVLEFMFRAANRCGLLHDKCISGGVVNVNQSSLFMSGKECKVLGIRCAKAHFTGEVSYIVRDIIILTNSGSHSADEGGEHLNVVAHRAAVGTPYLLFSLAYRLMDVLIWFKNYVDENPDVAANKRLWQDLDAKPSVGSWLAGRVTLINDKGWGTFVPDGRAETLSILPAMVKDNSLSEGMEVKVLAEPQSNGKTFIKDVRM